MNREPFSSKKILVALPGAMRDKLDHVAAVEMRTRSDLMREAFRQYFQKFDERQAEISVEEKQRRVEPTLFVDDARRAQETRLNAALPAVNDPNSYASRVLAVAGRV